MSPPPTIEPRRRAVAAALAAAALAWAACKPAEEPPRYVKADALALPDRDVGVGALSGTVFIEAPAALEAAARVPPTIADVVASGHVEAGDPSSAGGTADGAADGGLRGVAPADDDAKTSADTASTAASDVATDVVDEVSAGDAPPPVIQLPDALVQKVLAPAHAEAQKAARRLNARGLKKHGRLDLGAAIRDYQDALEHWPGHHYSNYNLACAYALTGEPEKALLHLALISTIGDETARERLLRARTDADFEALTGDRRFRELTGFMPVTVTWASAADRGEEARRIARALLANQIPAEATRTAGTRTPRTPTLYVKRDDPLADRMAREVKRAVRLSGFTVQPADDLSAREPLLLVLPAQDTDEPAEVAVIEPVAAKRFNDYVGVRLAATVDKRLERLHLKETGFFVWETSWEDGKRRKRSGRYALRGVELALDYTEISETPTGDPRAPDIQRSEGQKRSVPVKLAPDGLRVDEILFRTGAP